MSGKINNLNIPLSKHLVYLVLMKQPDLLDCSETTMTHTTQEIKNKKNRSWEKEDHITAPDKTHTVEMNAFLHWTI